MSSSSRRSRNSLVGGKQTSTNQRPRKRNAKDAADESNLSFGSNVSIVFKGDESFEDQEEDEQQSDQRAGKLQKLEHNSSISEGSENAGSSRPVRQAALRSRRSLTATIASTKRRQSARLSQNFKAELGAKAKSSVAEGLLPASAANASVAHSSEIPASISSVGNLFAASSSGLQHQAGPSNQPAQIFNQHLALNPNQSKDRRLSLPAKCFSQVQQPAAASRLQQLELHKQQMGGQCQQQVAATESTAGVLPYHRSSTSQPLDDVTAALLNKEHHSDAPRLQQFAKARSTEEQKQQLLDLQQILQQQQQLQKQRQLQQQQQLSLQQGPPQSQTSVPGNSRIFNYQQQQQSNIISNNHNNNNGFGRQVERSGLGSGVQLPAQSNILYRVTSSSTCSGPPQPTLSTSNFSASSSSVLTSQQNSLPTVSASRQGGNILLTGVTAYPIARDSIPENAQVCYGMKVNNTVYQIANPNSVYNNGDRRTSLPVLSRVPVTDNQSHGNTASFDGGASSGSHQQQARPAPERGSGSCNNDDVMILNVPRSVTPTPEVDASNSRNVPSQAPSSSSTTVSGPLYLSSRIRPSPLPPLTWADRDLVWRQMCLKDRIYRRSPDALQRHPAVHQRMRAILLDWLSEVCEVYALHRETYYLAIDYIDRYLMVTQNVPKQQLQLLGITCLFIAAKVEEIYPPKISEFAYVTDGACRVEQITEKELVVVRTLSWHLSPLTINTWLNTYLQLLQEITRSSGATSADGLPIKATEFVYQRFSGETFVQICRLLDLCILDTSSLQFSPALLAAAALSYFFGSRIASKVSSFSTADLAPAQRWMKPFALVVQSMPEPAPLKSFRQVATEDSHNIQTKVVELDTLELAHKNVERLELEEQRRREQSEHRASLAAHQPTEESGGHQGQPWSRRSPPPVSVLTPPNTDEKREADMEASEVTSDHLIHSSCPSSSGGAEGDGLKTNSSDGSGMVVAAGHVGGHRPVVYNGTDAMEVS